jgi:hypothetical protein
LTGSEGDRAWLYFGPDESDNIHMHFECAAGSGFTTAEAFDPRREGNRLILISGDARGDFPATPHRDESGEIFGDAVKAQARVDVDEPVIAAFRQSGALSSGDPPEAFRVATPEELSRIQSFFSSCARS